MRFESLRARAFGPFAERELRLAPGMTVVHGPNESGKSSWHAALYAGLCGMRRSRGGPRREDREFVERHQPWDGTAWQVAALVRLDSGRRVELRHDLQDGVDSRATDADLGRDVSAEIIHEGSPDGARWLGLDRRSFLAIACVRQADILGVQEDPAFLQDHLQRAAATAGTDATAAAALTCIDDYSREHVGQDRANSTKPLRQARERIEITRRALDAAQREHAGFLGLAAHADALAAVAAGAGRRARLLQVVRALGDAEAWQRRLARAQELAARCPEAPPTSPGADDVVGRAAAAAVQAWEQRPHMPVLQGPSSVDLRAAIDVLPPPPEGDYEPHPDVRAARSAHDRAQQAVELHTHEQPRTPVIPDTAGLLVDDLRNLADSIETPIPTVDPALQQRLDRAQTRLEEVPERRGRGAALGAGAVLAVGGVVAVALGPLGLGLGLVVAGLAVMLWAAIGGTDAARVGALEELRAAEAALGEQLHAVRLAGARRAAASAQVTSRGLTDDPAALRALADARTEANRLQRDLDHWTERHQGLAEALHSAERRLRAALEGRRFEGGPSAAAACVAYVAACAERARMAEEAAKRPGLETQLAARVAAEQAVEDAATRRQHAEELVRRSAAACGLDGDSERVDGLRAWLQRRPGVLAELEARRTAWVELQTLLDGGTLDALAAETARRVQEAERLQATVDPAELAGVPRTMPDADELARQQREADEACQAAERARGQAEERARQAPNVAEAEEALAAAETELARVRQLEATLALTREFLQRAEERVHRDIARLLADTIRAWLPQVTASRYTDVVIDPRSLEVRVRGGDDGDVWRNAALLSRGTAEQVYLLLRLALARHLARPDETCPLILDDITVHCDSQRKPGVLELLHAISRERQVILFSQEDEVLAWAQAHLQEPQDRLERLSAAS